MTSQKPPYPRPLSPHLQVYRPQLTSVLSILHRATGMGLLVGAYALVIWTLALATGPAVFDLFTLMFKTWIGQLALWKIVFCAYYHLANGVRHLCWDAGLGFNLRTVYASGLVVLLFAVGATVATWFLVS